MVAMRRWGTFLIILENVCGGFVRFEVVWRIFKRLLLCNSSFFLQFWIYVSLEYQIWYICDLFVDLNLSWFKSIKLRIIFYILQNISDYFYGSSDVKSIKFDFLHDNGKKPRWAKLVYYQRHYINWN